MNKKNSILNADKLTSWNIKEWFWTSLRVISILWMLSFFNTNAIWQQIYMNLPDLNWDWKKEPLKVKTIYDINSFIKTIVGNKYLKEIGDEVLFADVFDATWCYSDCANESLPFYHSNWQMYWIMWVDRETNGKISFPTPGRYLVTIITKNGLYARETLEVTDNNLVLTQTNISTSWLLQSKNPEYFAAIPDSDNNWKKDNLQTNVKYNINNFITRTSDWKNIVETWDSIAFLSVFLATGCETSCADLSTPFYQTNWNMFGIAWADRQYNWYVQFPMEWKYLLVWGTYKWYGVRETALVSDFAPITNRDTVFIERVVRDTVVDQNSFATTELDICEKLWELITVTSLQDLSNHGIEISVAPNPTAHSIKLIMNEITEEQFKSIDFYNINGQKVLSSREKEIDVSNLSDWYYSAILTFEKWFQIKVKNAFIKVH
jgi:hypothetical protein